MQRQQTGSGIARRIKWADIMRIHIPPFIEAKLGAAAKAESDSNNPGSAADLSRLESGVGHS
jgi:hypothetical protein